MTGRMAAAQRHLNAALESCDRLTAWAETAAMDQAITAHTAAARIRIAAADLELRLDQAENPHIVRQTL